MRILMKFLIWLPSTVVTILFWELFIILGEKCVKQYIQVRAAHDKFEATIDEEGNICKEFFLNLDRLQIVSEAYKYVHHLWEKANCRCTFSLVHNLQSVQLRKRTSRQI